jgi:hypothetical protein
MSTKPILSIKCPCCQHILEVSVEQERVLSFRKGVHLTEDRRDGEDAMDAALRNKREGDARVVDEFQKAEDNVRNAKARVDDLFREATRKAQEKGGDAPRKLWD